MGLQQVLLEQHPPPPTPGAHSVRPQAGKAASWPPQLHPAWLPLLKLLCQTPLPRSQV